MAEIVNDLSNKQHAESDEANDQNEENASGDNALNSRISLMVLWKP